MTLGLLRILQRSSSEDPGMMYVRNQRPWTRAVTRYSEHLLVKLIGQEGLLNGTRGFQRHQGR